MQSLLLHYYVITMTELFQGYLGFSSNSFHKTVVTAQGSLTYLHSLVEVLVLGGLEASVKVTVKMFKKDINLLNY